MVCHETYKDIEGNWLSQVLKIDNKTIEKIDNSEVKIGPSESMSKSKKNTIDPETMIKSYGDAVRWFILSDSPPDKMFNGRIGCTSSNKFLQKIWNIVL